MDDYTLTFYEENGQWNWKVTARNGEVIVDTKGEVDGFVSKSNAERNFALVQKALLTL